NGEGGVSRPVRLCHSHPGDRSGLNSARPQTESALGLAHAPCRAERRWLRRSSFDVPFSKAAFSASFVTPGFTARRISAFVSAWRIYHISHFPTLPGSWTRAYSSSG